MHSGGDAVGAARTGWRAQAREWPRFAAWSAALLLSACVTAPHPAPQAWLQRDSVLQSLGHFELHGRLAASNGQDGFSAGLRWQQSNDQALIDLTAPLGFGAAHIEQTASSLQVTTSKGVTLSDDAALEQLRATLGFEPPISSLRYWILGASDPAHPAETAVDASQRLTRLTQDGWRVLYGQYAKVGEQWLPRSLTVTRDALRLRVVVDTWSL